MQFICEPCKDAADSTVHPDVQKEMHITNCPGGNRCDCQHRVKAAE